MKTLVDLNKNLQVKYDEVHILSYDTTFWIVDFYVSVLVFKHVTFYTHERKSQKKKRKKNNQEFSEANLQISYLSAPEIKCDCQR